MQILLSMTDSFIICVLRIICWLLASWFCNALVGLRFGDNSGPVTENRCSSKPGASNFARWGAMGQSKGTWGRRAGKLGSRLGFISIWGGFRGPILKMF